MSENVTTPPRLALLDDGATDDCSNGVLARASVMANAIRALRYIQHAGRPIFHLVGQPSVFANAQERRFIRLDTLDGGGRYLAGLVGGIRNTTTVSATQGLRLSEGVTPHDTAWPSTASVNRYPEDLVPIDIVGPLHTGSAPATVNGYELGQIDAQSPQLSSACIYEDARSKEDSDIIAMEDPFVPNNGIVATKSGSRSTLDVARERFLHVWRNRRPHFGWSGQYPDTTGYIDLTTSKNNYRYIFDQTIGDGGTAPSATGKAATLPLRYSGAGRRTQIRVYVWVYARLSAGTGTGTIAVANKDASGTMGGMTALTNNVAITGTSFTWWPHTGSWDPATNAYFNGYAGGAFDRVLVGGKTSGTASLQIGAYMLVPFHSTL
jgi:hypothetical protein